MLSTVTVVNTPEVAEFAPIVAPSIVPLLISIPVITVSPPSRESRLAQLAFR